MDKPFSLCIGWEKLQQLKDKETKVVAHKCTVRWKSFLKQKPTTVRFFDLKFFEHAIFKVSHIQELKYGHERFIKIIIDEQVL